MLAKFLLLVVKNTCKFLTIRSKFSRDPPQQEVAPEVEHEQHDFRTVLRRHVDTKQHPKVIGELEDINAVEGNSVTLQCQVVGVPPPVVTWIVGKKEIKVRRSL